MLAWLVIVVNAIVLFYVCVFPGFSVADQAANPPNTKGMFTFDGNSFLTFTLPNYEIYSSSSENIQNLLINQIKSPIISRESRLPIPVLFCMKPVTEWCHCKVRICKSLFQRCMKPNPMRFQCDWFAKSILGLTTEQQTMRSMMTLALAFGNFSVFTGMMALDWKRFWNNRMSKIKDVDDKSSGFVT